LTTVQDIQYSNGESTLKLSIIIPVYNQQQNVSLSLKRIKEVLDATTSDYEMVVVNDGSLDDTLEVLKAEQKTNTKIRIITYTPNMGKGYAVKMGVDASKGQMVMFTDGDLDISPAVIMEYIQKLDGVDLVIASKRHPLSKINAPLSRKFLSRAFNLIVRIATGIKLKDTQSGLKAGNGNVLRKMFRIMVVKRYAFDVELLTIASMLDLKIKELPIEIDLDRRFKMRDIAKMFIDVIAVSYRYRIKRWYQHQIQSEPSI
jgi:dolichol-phosphate mannosyltransferase